MDGLKRVLRFTAFAIVVAALVLAVVFRSWVGAQARVLAILCTTSRAPVLAWAVTVVTHEPRVEETVVAGAPTTLVRPGRGKRWPAVVFVNGATARGRHHPDVERLARALGRVGYLVLVPDLPGLRRGEITPRTARAAAAVARYAADRPDARGGRVGLFGVSVGATLALLAAESPELQGRVSLVAGFAPYTDLRRVIELATTGRYPTGARVIHYRAGGSLPLVVGRSVLASALRGRDRSRLLALLPSIDGEVHDPLARLRIVRIHSLAPAARAVVRLLANRDARRFGRLWAALPSPVRAEIRRMSPITEARRLRAPVELASAPHDKYFPLAESRRLAPSAPRVRITITSTLAHAVPHVSLGDVAALLRFDAFGIRVLEGFAHS
jgi:pimeloyl-ACP methyl ester carboxylesterase